MTTPIDPKERFSGVAGLYARFRPDYPDAALDWLLEGLRPGARVVDLGCGTGILTRRLAARGFSLVGVDPNEAMLSQTRGGEFVKGDAEATGLPSGSAELVVAAQAWHWFDPPRALAECRRLLKPGRRAAALWNLRAATPFLKDYDALLARSCSGYETRLEAAKTLAAIRACGVADYEERAFENPERLDRESLFGRVFSASYVAHGLKDRPRFEAALGALFETHARDGAVDFLYRTVAARFVP